MSTRAARPSPSRRRLSEARSGLGRIERGEPAVISRGARCRRVRDGAPLARRRRRRRGATGVRGSSPHRAGPCRRRARPPGLPGTPGASRGFGEPGRLQHRRRSFARRGRGRAGAFRGGPRDRAAPARRMSRRARPRPASAGSRSSHPGPSPNASECSLRAGRRRDRRSGSTAPNEPSPWSRISAGGRTVPRSRRLLPIGRRSTMCSAAPPAKTGPSQSGGATTMPSP